MSIAIHRSKVLFAMEISSLCNVFKRRYWLLFITEMIKQKYKRRKPFRNILASEGRKEEKEIENLLSVQEWFDLYRETCKGLLQMASSSSGYKVTYFIYCAAITQKFSGSLEKVSLFMFVVVFVVIIYCYQRAYVS